MTAIAARPVAAALLALGLIAAGDARCALAGPADPRPVSGTTAADGIARQIEALERLLGASPGSAPPAVQGAAAPDPRPHPSAAAVATAARRVALLLAVPKAVAVAAGQLGASGAADYPACAQSIALCLGRWLLAAPAPDRALRSCARPA